MKFFYNLTVAVSFFLLFGKPVLFAEGTKQIMATPISHGRLEIYQYFSNFALYGVSEEYRLNIRIKEVGEKIYFGFGNTYDAFQTLKNDVKYRIKDPSGNIVVAETMQSASGNGFISNFTQAVNGPNTINVGGYPPLTYTPATTGDYYIEFTYVDQSDRREFEFFDITVADAGNNAVDGRVWSKAWQFTVSSSAGSGQEYLNKFDGTMYIYADDGIVTSVDFNEMQPYVFSLSSNKTGCFNTGNLINDRKSVTGLNLYPQYKIFLNEPDSTCFPTGVLGSLTAPTKLTGCPPDDWCIDISVNKEGTVDIVIDLNDISGYQAGSEDILLNTNVINGVNCIPWNGKDGLGNKVPFGKSIKIMVQYYNGLTHLPLYDVEYNTNGFIVKIIKPAVTNSTPALFWDDSNFNGQTPAPPSPCPADGCVDLSGSHKFGDPATQTMNGDLRTINTWWYVSSDIKDSVDFVYTYIQDSVTYKDEICSKNSGSITVYSYGGKPPYTYAWNTNPIQTGSTATGLSAGSYSVTITDDGSCKDTIINVVLDNIPFDIKVDVDTVSDVCDQGIGEIFITTSDGTPPYSYVWNTDPPYYTSDVTGIVSGTYIVTVTDVNNCEKLDTVVLDNVYCNIVIPNVFTPDGDGVNDYFTITDIEKYINNKLIIFNRWGRKVREYNHYVNNWDGTDENGSKAVDGVYYYVLYLTDKSKAITGTITILK